MLVPFRIATIRFTIRSSRQITRRGFIFVELERKTKPYHFSNCVRHAVPLPSYKELSMLLGTKKFEFRV